MPDRETGQWYTNKEIFERLMTISEDFVELRGEMRETRTLIKKYNGLREEINNIKKESAVIHEKVTSIINREEGRNLILDNLRNWGGWIFGLLTLVILIYNQLV